MAHRKGKQMTREKFTREDALKNLRLWREEYDTDSKLPNAWTLDMAISALEQPCETSTDEPMTMVYPTIFCDDAISREDAINAIATDYITAVRNLESLPSVQPSRKGHWIDVSNFVYECSNCGGRGMFRELFCPNCGCFMGDKE